MVYLRKKKTIFEDQLNQLSELGIFMRADLKKELLLEETSRSEYEEDPYNLLLLTLGGEVAVNDEFINVSDKIWYLDTEYIEDHGDYARVIMRFKNMTKLNLNKITDCVDIQNSTAWASFEHKNELLRWEMKVDDDYGMKIIIVINLWNIEILWIHVRVSSMKQFQNYRN
ncbi:hypothetical protein [Paenibacillus sp. EKM211P]|uniref:hypothetical protein n=1 Tax=Paenibacillus sp. EKM211P TaxID=1683679 RepID=UPI001EECCD1C|nr:hypothetical protein [Paenibacillus sp. EKM211P]